MEHEPKFWTATEYDCVRIDFDDLNGCILFGKDSKEHARLIAAAPDLLKMCGKLANIAEVVGHCTGTWTQEHQALAQEYAAEARETIAKTKG